MAEEIRTREPLDLHPRAVLLVGLGTLLFLLLSLGGLFWVYDRFGIRGNQPPAPQPFPAPELQADPRGDLARFLAEQREGLEGYGWVDRAQGLVRIPVRRAMEIQAGRGMDAYAPLEAPEPGVPLPVRPEAARRGEAGP
ncbi:hypothetical protein MVG78_02300 [Roseomonas gilardii subsp. gilardii]|uniref:hypothetical protein n=1 Tax=Roseomonas gilardii TaxID=257708 RepID=UPI001FF991C5|nr:hypothetical protein [Roseomonas gilardii]UPG73035.1 hypothetical protein MVG78_02300 [Roseomonas gilardii subsp. gilardii]